MLQALIKPLFIKKFAFILIGIYHMCMYIPVSHYHIIRIMHAVFNLTIHVILLLNKT